MSGARLCALLGELGYEGHESLDPDSFEWPFQYDDARPVLDWLCSSLRPSNVLSPSEVTQYEHLLHEEKLLEGEDLDFAYDSISAFSTRRENQEAVFGSEEGLKDIRDATLALKAEELELQKQLRRLQSQYDMLTGQASALIQGRRARVAATSVVNGQQATIADSLSARNLEMNAVIGRMASTAQELADYHSGDGLTFMTLKSSTNIGKLTVELVFLAVVNEILLLGAEFYSGAGPYRLVAEEGKSKCSWVSLNDISNVLLRDLEKSHHQRVSELQRLRSIFGPSERQWIEAQVENAKQQAILTALKGQVTSDEAHIHLDLHSLRRKHAELVGEISILYRKEEKLLSEFFFQTIPDLCWELAQLQDTYILEGDYDLKVMRQEFYINRQKAFINHLINHVARHQFLKVACQLEKKTMLGAFSLLKVIESELHGYLSATKGRVGRCMALIQASSDVQEQGAVDDRDTFLHGIRDLLNIQAGPSTYVSAPGIVQQISSLRSDLMSLQYDLEHTLPQDRDQCINKLCILLQSLQQLLFASSTTAQPILTPQTLMKQLATLEDYNKNLSRAIEDVTSEHLKKNEIYRHQKAEKTIERRVFVDFFCYPERLRNKVMELAASVGALQSS
ncbi:hypothetical protein RND71_006855 [Anisodus tanguticus]|uniref:HAUS augmin-like complex subunit 3 N-terminal domain-containing protein n=1 Tax=Anisodus tanguticus TaxID=243964 RepID=A0AAE1VMR0_9SOLA|nr:hypothetical protein RND71_006855 [Anisodus tanguticus]